MFFVSFEISTAFMTDYDCCLSLLFVSQFFLQRIESGENIIVKHNGGKSLVHHAHIYIKVKFICISIS